MTQTNLFVDEPGQSWGGSKYAVLVCGPNSSGKSTAVRMALDGLEDGRRVRAVYADNRDRRLFDGPVDEQERRLAGLYLGDSTLVLVIEGTRVATQVARIWERNRTARELAVFVTTTSPETMRAQLEARCRRLGKRFRDDYWTLSACEGESRKRYQNMARRYGFPDLQVMEIDAAYQQIPQLVSAIRGKVEGWLS